MYTNKIQKVVIAGGGTAGWIVAAALSKKLGKVIDVTLVESDDIGTIGVGEATIPPMLAFHQMLGINEQEFMRATSATFKLGISFENWKTGNDQYMHSFGSTGKGSWECQFVHFWLNGKERGLSTEYSDYCYETQAAKAQKFSTSKISYAYHLDATLYAKFLRDFSEKNGLKRIEGKIKHVTQNTSTGFIESLILESGQVIEGDLFIDCTGFSGLLIEQTLHTGFEDWSHWLPCNSAVVVQTETVGPILPYTRSIAHQAGWQWCIPLQGRVGNGLVFCDRFMSSEEATQLLLSRVEGQTLNSPRTIHYKTGRRHKAWNKNCVALGLSSGFLEPLESTSIYLFMIGVSRLIQTFPFDGIHPVVVDEYNAQTKVELEAIRDFVILHYHVTQRDDSPFWHYCKNMEIPKTLQHKIKLFEESAHVFLSNSELFRLDSWTKVMLGQGIMPKQYHHIAKTISDGELSKFLNYTKAEISQSVEQLPTHENFINDYCKHNAMK